MYMPKQNCIYYSSRSKCGHPDRGKTVLGGHKDCILNPFFENDFITHCSKRVGHECPSGPPPPTPPAKRVIREDVGICRCTDCTCSTKK